MSWVTRIGIVLCVIAGSWLLMGCSSLIDDSEEDKAEQSDELVEFEEVLPADKLYERGLARLQSRSLKKAIEDFELVEREYPASDWAKRAQIMAGYAAYRQESYAEAALILERFVKLHPNHEQTPYAYYLRALTYYDQIVDVGRDQKTTQMARQSLREVVSRFPDSDYARDAAIKLELTEDHLAGKEMEIGRFYLERDEYLAAVGRFQHVIDNYQTTSHTPEALHRLVEAYLQLGVKPEAKKYAAVLGHNYPGSDWYRYSYEMLHGNADPAGKPEDKGWLGGVIPGL